MAGIFDHVIDRLSKRNWDNSANALAIEIQLMLRGIGGDTPIQGPVTIDQPGNTPGLVINTPAGAAGPPIGIQTPDGQFPNTIIGGTVTGGFTGPNLTITNGGVVFGNIAGGFSDGGFASNIGDVNVGLNGGVNGDGMGAAASTPGGSDTTTVGVGGGGGLVGQVVSGSGSSYTLKVFQDADPLGSSPSPKTVAAQPLNVDPAETVPPATWVQVYNFGGQYRFTATTFAAEVPS